MASSDDRMLSTGMRLVATSSEPFRRSADAKGAAYFSGDSASATPVRSQFGRGMDAVQRLRRSRPPNRMEKYAFRARAALRWVILGVAALLLVFWRYPTGFVVVWILLGALVALLALELLVRPALAWQQQHGDADAGPRADA
ncbi:hypothetical protein [Nocardia asiatica]|uniref:hypothetical protein n=1 Tax=Nocardia asiatica TaxID=209252 RepID=UPI003CC7E8A8